MNKKLLNSTLKSKISILNLNLINKQKINDEDVKLIHKLHIIKNCYLSFIESSNSKEDIRRFAKFITVIEFRLQNLWKFKEDINYHRFWNLPKCSCPKMDNMDDYGSGFRHINLNCIIHGN